MLFFISSLCLIFSLTYAALGNFSSFERSLLGQFCLVRRSGVLSNKKISLTQSINQQSINQIHYKFELPKFGLVHVVLSK